MQHRGSGAGAVGGVDVGNLHAEANHRRALGRHTHRDGGCGGRLADRQDTRRPAQQPHHGVPVERPVVGDVEPHHHRGVGHAEQPQDGRQGGVDHRIAAEHDVGPAPTTRHAVRAAAAGSHSGSQRFDPPCASSCASEAASRVRHTPADSVSMPPTAKAGTSASRRAGGRSRAWNLDNLSRRVRTFAPRRDVVVAKAPTRPRRPRGRPAGRRDGGAVGRAGRGVEAAVSRRGRGRVSCSSSSGFSPTCCRGGRCSAASARRFRSARRHASSSSHSSGSTCQGASGPSSRRPSWRGTMGSRWVRSAVGGVVALCWGSSSGRWWPWGACYPPRPPTAVAVGAPAWPLLLAGPAPRRPPPCGPATDHAAPAEGDEAAGDRRHHRGRLPAPGRGGPS